MSQRAQLPLATDSIRALLPTLARVAALVGADRPPGPDELVVLLPSSEVGVDPDLAIAELRRWAEILRRARHDGTPPEIAVEALRLRGVPEAPAMLAIDVARARTSDPSAETFAAYEIVVPGPPTAVGRGGHDGQVGAGEPLSVEPDVLLLGTLQVNEVARATLRVRGGPGQVRPDSDLISVTPAALAEDETEVAVQLQSSMPGLLYSRLWVEFERGARIEVPVTALVAAPDAAPDAPTVAVPLVVPPGSQPPPVVVPPTPQQPTAPHRPAPGASQPPSGQSAGPVPGARRGVQLALMAAGAVGLLLVGLMLGRFWGQPTPPAATPIPTVAPAAQTVGPAVGQPTRPPASPTTAPATPPSATTPRPTVTPTVPRPTVTPTRPAPTPRPTEPPVTGSGLRIREPASGASVTSELIVRGSLARPLERGRHLWVLVRADVSDGRWYAYHRGEIRPEADNSWACDLYLGGSAGIRHEVRAGIVDDATHQQLSRFIQANRDQPLPAFPERFEEAVSVMVTRR